MKKTIQKVFVAIILFFGILLISNLSNASGLRLKNLDYQVQLNADGTAEVVETWN